MDKVTSGELIESLSQRDRTLREVFGILAFIVLSPFMFMMFCLDWIDEDPNTEVWQSEYY
jgi:hypothetical protein